jgi:hypothetical protein
VTSSAIADIQPPARSAGGFFHRFASARSAATGLVRIAGFCDLQPVQAEWNFVKVLKHPIGERLKMPTNRSGRTSEVWRFTLPIDIGPDCPILQFYLLNNPQNVRSSTH